jgi:hypothetical protein
MGLFVLAFHLLDQVIHVKTARLTLAPARERSEQTWAVHGKPV